MKRFLLLICVFFLPLIGFIASIFTVDLPRKYAYQYTRNDGCNIGWIYRRIYENEKNIDVAFLGTSHTGCGINDRLLDSLHPGLNHVNLAYCQGGRSIQFAVLKDVLSRHKLKKLVLEVRLNEDLSSHRDFGLVGRLEDVGCAPLKANSRYVKDIFKAFQVRYMYFQDRTLNMLPQNLTPDPDPDYSYYPIFKDTADVTMLANHLKDMKLKVENHKSNVFYEYKLNYPYEYLQRIKSLCEASDVELILLYLPSFGMAGDLPYQHAYYKTLGPLLVPEKSLFTNDDYWFDQEHLNIPGATNLTTWVGQQLYQ